MVIPLISEKAWAPVGRLAGMAAEVYGYHRGGAIRTMKRWLPTAFSWRCARRLWVATRTISDDMRKSAFLRMEEIDAWAERSPAFGYHGNKLIWSHLEEGSAVLLSPQIAENDQFALEMDHFREYILKNKAPRALGEVGCGMIASRKQSRVRGQQSNGQTFLTKKC
jgi:hypothetical protein